MNEPDNTRIQELFLAALERVAEQRDAWLAKQCGDDEELLREVRSLLEHDSPDDDPLEKRLDEALEVPSTLILDTTAGGELSESDVTQVDSELFLSKLSEVGVLSPEEIDTLNRTVASGQSSADPRQIATQLVAAGKLTDYQASALLKGQPELLIDKYLILDLLDAGGMGMVFKAIHRPMNRTVAIKMIAQHLLASPEQVKRFQREVRVAATLEHANVVRSYDADQSRGVHFLVMEYVRGENLTKIIQRQGPLSVEMAVDCIRQAAKGLRYAQKKGVIHRDIKPGNLMLNDEGQVKVLDLGLANIDESFRLAQQSSITGEPDSHTAQSLAGSELTTAGAVLGTVSFMAPEQLLDSHKADTRADIYSLGCTLYYLLIGEAPYKGDTIFQVFMQHREAEIPTLRDKRPDVPEKVELVCRKMLAKSPEKRYQSMGELLSAIEDCDIALPPEQETSGVRKGSGKRTRVFAERPNEAHSRQRRSKHPGSQTTVPAQGMSVGGSSSITRRVTTALALLLALGGGYWWWQQNASQDDSQQSHTADTTPTDEGEIAKVSQQVAVATPQYALEFSEDSDQVELPKLGFDPNTPATIEVWCTSFQHSVKERHNIIALDGLLALESSSEMGHRFVATIGNKDFVWQKCDRIAGVFGERVYLAGVYDGESLRLFVNGTAIDTSLHRMWFKDDEWNHENLVPPMKKLGNPRLHNSALGYAIPGMPAFIGTIDEVRISTSARYTADFTPSERFEADADTLALYRFDEGEGDILHDSSGNGHDGKIVGAQWVKVYDEANMSAADLLATGEYEWRVVERLSLPPSGSGDITADALTIIFDAYKREGGYGGSDLWVATRPNVDAPWSPPINLGDRVNTPEREVYPALSPDGLTMLFKRGRNEILVTTRESLTAEWSNPRPFELTSGTPPDPTQDGFVCVTGYNDDLVLWRKLTETDGWRSLTAFPESINAKDMHKNFGALSDDGRLLVFQRAPISAQGLYFKNCQVWMATRSTSEGEWSEAQPISGLDTMGNPGSPRLHSDGKSLLFSCDRDGQRRLYLARLERKDAPVEPIKGMEDQLETPGEWKWPEDAPAPAIAPFNSEQAIRHQDEWAEHLGVPAEYTNSIGMKFRLIPPGEFLMGTPAEEVAAWKDRLAKRHHTWIDSEAPAKRVVIDTPFYMGCHEVTIAQFEVFAAETQYKTLAETNGTGGVRYDQGVERVRSNPQFTWRYQIEETDHSKAVGTLAPRDIDAFVKWLNAHEPHIYQVPTEAQWEFSCRAGTTTPWYCSEDELAKVSWHDPRNFGEMNVHAVGTKAPNPFGLFDFYGNIEEYVKNGNKWIARGIVDPNPALLRSAARADIDFPNNGPWYLMGMRLVLSVDSVRSTLRDAPPTDATSAAELLATGEVDGEVLKSAGAPLKTDLLRNVDVARDVKHDGSTNRWNRTLNGIELLRGKVFTPAQTSYLKLPDEVSDSYRFDCEVTSEAYFSGIRLPVGESYAYVCLRKGSKRNMNMSLGLLDFDESSEERFVESNSKAFRNGVRHRVTAIVQLSSISASIQVFLDGELVVDYTGEAKRLSVWSFMDSHRFPGKTVVFRANGPITIHSATLTPISAADLLATGEWEWRVVEQLPIPKEHTYLGGADMSEDGLTLVIASAKWEGQYGEHDLWIATRPSLDSQWSQFENLGDSINSENREHHPALSPDGLTLLFTKNHAETLISRRDSKTETWSKAEPFEIVKGFYSPDPTPNGRFLLQCQDDSLLISKRSSLGGPWPIPTTLGPPVNTDAKESTGALSEDGRLLLFDRRGDGNDGPLWMSLRADERSEWSEPVIVDSLNLEVASKPRLLPNGKSLLIGNTDAIYLARLVRKDAPQPETHSVNEGSENESATTDTPEPESRPANEPADETQPAPDGTPVEPATRNSETEAAEKPEADEPEPTAETPRAAVDINAFNGGSDTVVYHSLGTLDQV